LKELMNILRDLRANPELLAIRFIKDATESEERIKALIRVLISACRKDPEVVSRLKLLGNIILEVVNYVERG